MLLPLRSLLIVISVFAVGSSSLAETVIVHLRPSAQSLVLGTIDTEDDAFRRATPVTEDGNWYQTLYRGSFAGFVESSALGPDGKIRLGTEVFLTPSREGVKMTVVEANDQITVNLVDRWVEITFRKPLEAYFRKPATPAATRVEPDFAVTVSRQPGTDAALILPPEPTPTPTPAPPPADPPEPVTEPVAEVPPPPPAPETPREAPTPPDPEVLVLDDTSAGSPGDAGVDTPSAEQPDPLPPSAATATILTADPVPAEPTPVPSTSAEILPPSDVAVVEDAPVVIEGASVAGIPEQELGRQPTLQPASGLTRRFDGQIREVRWVFRRPPFRFELRDYNNDHIAYLDISRTVISSFTDLKDSVVIIYGTIEGLGNSSKRVIRVQTLSRRR